MGLEHTVQLFDRGKNEHPRIKYATIPRLKGGERFQKMSEQKGCGKAGKRPLPGGKKNGQPRADRRREYPRFLVPKGGPISG